MKGESPGKGAAVGGRRKRREARKRGDVGGTQTIFKVGGPHGSGDTESCSLLCWKAGGWGGREDTAWRWPPGDPLGLSFHLPTLGSSPVTWPQTALPPGDRTVVQAAVQKWPVFRLLPGLGDLNPPCLFLILKMGVIIHPFLPKSLFPCL